AGPTARRTASRAAGRGARARWRGGACARGRSGGRPREPSRDRGGEAPTPGSGNSPRSQTLAPRTIPVNRARVLLVSPTPRRLERAPRVGQAVSHYRLIEPLGAGGMGVVWKAEDTTLQRLVAIKFLAENLVRDAERLERFKREAMTIAALNHPN